MWSSFSGGVALSRVEAEMDSIMRASHMVQKQLKSWKPSSSSVVSSLQMPGKILNDSVSEVCKPPRRPSIEIVFFHGLSLDGMDPHLRSWLSADGSELWPMGISNEIPCARILLISYAPVDHVANTIYASREIWKRKFLGDSFKYVQVQVQQMNDMFRLMRYLYKWRAFGIQAGLRTKFFYH
ncbi:unnamed protein product [Calypogeia fissa]